MEKSNDYSSSRIIAWLLTHQLVVSIGHLEGNKFTKVGLTIPQFYIIAALNYLKSPVTPSDLSQCLARNLNTITLTLDRMEKAGLVKRKRDLPDRRTVRVVLTPKSKKLFSEAVMPFMNFPNDIMSELTDDELEVYNDLTKKLVKGLHTKFGISELRTHRIDTVNYILKKNKGSFGPVDLDI